MSKAIRLAVAMTAAVSASVLAGPGFNLQPGGLGIWTANTGNTPIAPGSVVQLIWTADAAYAGAIEGQFDAAGYLAYGDYILNQTDMFTTDYVFQDAGAPYNQGGGWTGDLDGNATYTDAMVGGNNIQNGFVYMRVFNATSMAGITGGTLYMDSNRVDVNNDQTPPSGPPVGTPQTVSFSGVNPVYVDNVGGGGYDGGSVMTQTVTAVPEPSVFAFLGIGAAFLGLRRKMARS